MRDWCALYPGFVSLVTSAKLGGRALYPELCPHCILCPQCRPVPADKRGSQPRDTFALEFWSL